jgi:SAM-dependent methyltransferase
MADSRALTEEYFGHSYFERLYQKQADPWNYERSEYEARKYEASVRALPRDKYRHALEIGCSIGVLTAKLASRCEKLLSLDTSETALEIARQRCRVFSQVSFQLMTVPHQYPDDIFDLTVLSEVGYYLSLEDLKILGDRISSHTCVGGHLLLVHWVPPASDRVLCGDDVHQHFISRPEWRRLCSSRNDHYRLDLLEHTGDPADRR